ncbi:MAG: DUF3857 and transglutaminase domain-containing protein, partial [Victivallales bacterium]|nr:DUF3857 and transglutaminase domain-containing protein [Victivallales bacterium]
STNENTADLFPAYLANCSYLVARPEGEDLQTSPVPSSSENRMEIETTSYINEYGTLTGTTILRFKGINDSMYRSFFAENTPNDTKNFLERVVNNTIPGALLTDYSIAPKDMMDTDTEVSLKLTFNAPSYVSGNENLSFLRIPSFAGRFGIHNYIIKDASLDKRRFPFQCRYKCSVTEQNTIHCAPKWGIPEQIPEFKEIDTKTMAYKQDVTYHNHILVSNSEMRIETIQFSPQEYQELKENLKTIEFNRHKMPVLKRKYALPELENEPDIVKLSETTDITLKNAFAWTEKHYVKYQIMSYGGKKDYSELKFQYIPECEDFKLEFAKVYNGENCTELNLSENKLMDAGWNGSAPRYPKGQTLVANLPAVEIGSIVEYQYSYEHKTGDLPFSFVTSFRETVPILHQSITISHPESIQLAFNLSQNGAFMPKGKDNIEYRKITNFGVVQHFWNTSNQKAYLQESNLPRLRYIMPSLCVTTGNWKNYCHQLRKAIEARTYDADALRKIAGDMKGMDDAKKVRAIRDMVARSIRSAGPRFTELPFKSMSEAAVTLTDGYGNAMDKAILIYALLKAAGLKPEFILAKGSSNAEIVDAELVKFFAPSLFASPIVRVKCDGKWVWLNESSQYAELGTCGYEGQKAITLDGKIFTIEVPDKFKTKEHRKIHIRLFANGDARFEVKDTYYGQSHNAINKELSEQTQEDRRRYHLALLNALSQTATPDGEMVTNVTTYPATVSFAANIKNFATEQGNILYFACPRQSVGTFNAPQNTRRLPFEYTGHSVLQRDVVIELPGDYPNIAYLMPSKKFTLPGETYTYTYSASAAKNTITVSTAINARPFLIPANKYESLQAVLRQIISPSLNTIILSK